MDEQPAGRRLFDPASAGYLVCASLFAIFAAYACSRPMVNLLGYLSDDGFYYLQIARHIAAGQGSTFDGIHPTNGYQPLWMIVCVILAKVFAGKYALVRAALATEFAFHLASSLMVARVLGRFLDRRWAYAGAALWLVNPFAIYISVALVEAPLYVCTLLLAMDCFLSVAAEIRSGTITTRRAALLGLALALCVLARTDSIFLATFAILILFADALRHKLLVALTIGKLSAGIGSIAVILAPWLLYNLAIVHTFALDSGAMKSLWASTGNAGLSPWQQSLGGLSFLWSSWLTFPAIVALRGKFQDAPWIPAIYLIVVGAAIWRMRSKTTDSPIQSFTIWLGATVIVTGLVYGVSLTDYQRWHFAQPATILFLLACVWIFKALDTVNISRRAVVIAVWGMVCVSVICGWAGLNAPYPWQRDVYRTQPIFERSIPVGQNIGCLNAGIPAYFSDRTVIDLDGLVNHPAVGFWRENRFDELLKTQKVTYICDEEWSLARALNFTPHTFGLVPVEQLPLTGWPTGKRLLWRVIWLK